MAYLPIDPADLGRSYQEVIRINSQSGKGGIAYVLEQMRGLQLPRWLQIDFSTVVQRHAEQSEAEVSPDAIWTLFQQHYLDQQTPYSLEAFEISHRAGHDHLVAKLLSDNQPVEVVAEGAGVVESFVGGLAELLGQELVLVDYYEHALSHNVHSEAACYVQMNIAGQRPKWGRFKPRHRRRFLAGYSFVQLIIIYVLAKQGLKPTKPLSIWSLAVQ